MPTYDRSEPTGYRLVDEWDGGFGWLAHPDETVRRASHAVVGEDGGVWLLDPLDAPGIEAEIDALGDVAGVAVCSSYHARDATAFATRYDVPVSVPEWMDRVGSRIDAPLERYAGELGASGLRVREARPLPGMCEAIAYRRSDGTLYAPDLLGTAPLYTVGDERLGVYLFCRPVPPTDAFAGTDPERVLVGHGTGVFDDAAGALETALATARRGFPRALLENGGSQLRALVGALGD